MHLIIKLLTRDAIEAKRYPKVIRWLLNILFRLRDLFYYIKNDTNDKEQRLGVGVCL